MIRLSSHPFLNREIASLPSSIFIWYFILSYVLRSHCNLLETEDEHKTKSKAEDAKTNKPYSKFLGKSPRQDVASPRSQGTRYKGVSHSCSDHPTPDLRWGQDSEQAHLLAELGGFHSQGYWTSFRGCASLGSALGALFYRFLSVPGCCAQCFTLVG